MIIFYTSDTEDVVLASIVKHFNPRALLREYENNNDILSIAKMYEDPHFIRVKDYKLAILNKYNFPAWMKNESRMKYLELVLAHKETTTNEVISYVAKYLFKPEELFYSSLDKPRLFKNRASKVMKELNAFKRNMNHFNRRGIDYYEINPEHKIEKIFLKYLIDLYKQPFILLSNETALIGNAGELGFDKELVETSRYEALKLKKKLKIKPAIKRLVKETIATKICEY